MVLAKLWHTADPAWLIQLTKPAAKYFQEKEQAASLSGQTIPCLVQMEPLGNSYFSETSEKWWNK